MIDEFTESDARVIVVKPNKSSTWRANLYVLIAISIPSLGAAIGFTLLEPGQYSRSQARTHRLSAALYYVNWNLEYRQVVTVSDITSRLRRATLYRRKPGFGSAMTRRSMSLLRKTSGKDQRCGFTTEKRGPAWGNSSIKMRPRIYSSDCVDNYRSAPSVANETSRCETITTAFFSD